MKILFQGDSITDGNRLKDEGSRWDLNHQIGHSYAYIINGILGYKFPEKHYEFVNRGISGNKINDIYDRRQKDIFDIKPDVLSILVGTNDCQTEESVFYEKYKQLLTETKEALPNVKLILMGCFSYYKDERGKHTNELSLSTQKLADEFDALFIEYQSLFDNAAKIREEKYWIWDNIHPTENGHGMIADEWIKKTGNIIGL